jgi:hypothetical protein
MKISWLEADSILDFSYQFSARDSVLEILDCPSLIGAAKLRLLLETTNVRISVGQSSALILRLESRAKRFWFGLALSGLIQNRVGSVRGSGAAQQIPQCHQGFAVASGTGLEFLPAGPLERTCLGAGGTQKFTNFQQAVSVTIDQSGAQTQHECLAGLECRKGTFKLWWLVLAWHDSTPSVVQRFRTVFLNGGVHFDPETLRGLESGCVAFEIESPGPQTHCLVAFGYNKR